MPRGLLSRSWRPHRWALRATEVRGLDSQGQPHGDRVLGRSSTGSPEPSELLAPRLPVLNLSEGPNGWRASLADEGTVDSHRKLESDRITRGWPLQISLRNPEHAEMQWYSSLRFNVNFRFSTASLHLGWGDAPVRIQPRTGERRRAIFNDKYPGYFLGAFRWRFACTPRSVLTTLFPVPLARNRPACSIAVWM